jgi:hypothetical protein
MSSRDLDSWLAWGGARLPAPLPVRALPRWLEEARTRSPSARICGWSGWARLSRPGPSSGGRASPCPFSSPRHDRIRCHGPPPRGFRQVYGIAAERMAGRRGRARACRRERNRPKRHPEQDWHQPGLRSCSQRADGSCRATARHTRATIPITASPARRSDAPAPSRKEGLSANTTIRPRAGRRSAHDADM